MGNAQDRTFHHRPRIVNPDPNAVPPTPDGFLYPVRAAHGGHSVGAFHQSYVFLDAHEIRVRPLFVEEL